MVKRLNYLNELWLPRVQSEGAHFGEMDSQAPVRRRKPLERKFKAKFVCVCVSECVPVYARADDTKRDAQVDGGPIGAGLPAVAALLVPGDRLNLLQRLAALALLIRSSASSSASSQSARRHRAAALSLITTHTHTHT